MTAVPPWRRSIRIAGSAGILVLSFPRLLVDSLSSHSRQSTPTTTACRSGWPVWTTFYRHFIWNVFSWDVTSYYIFAYGIGTHFPTMFGKRYSIRGRSPAPTSNERVWKLLSGATWEAGKTIRLKFTSF